MKTIAEFQKAILSTGTRFHLTIGPSVVEKGNIFVSIYTGNTSKQGTGDDLEAILEKLFPSAPPATVDDPDLLV